MEETLKLLAAAKSTPAVAPALSAPAAAPSPPDDRLPERKDKHVRYFMHHFNMLPAPYVGLDTTRLSAVRI
jgi:hypothetical protein